MANATKRSTKHSNHFWLVFVSLISLVIVVMVLTRLYFVEKETVMLKKQVTSLIEKTELQNVGAPVQGIFDSPYQQR
jgi:hypothetical protein